MPNSSPPPPAAPAIPDQSDSPTLAGVVLAGGASRRMGTDKALLVRDGRTLLDLAIEHLRQAGATEIVVASGPSARYDTSVTQVVDPSAHVGDGPLAGLAAAFAYLTDGGAGGDVARRIALVLAVDLPDADPGLLRHLADRLDRSPGLVAAVAVDPTGRPQPLHAAYDIAATRDAATKALERGDKRVLPVVLDDLGAALVDPGPGIGNPRWHRNLNRPDDLDDPATATKAEDPATTNLD